MSLSTNTPNSKVAYIVHIIIIMIQVWDTIPNSKFIMNILLLGSVMRSSFAVIFLLLAASIYYAGEDIKSRLKMLNSVHVCVNFTQKFSDTISEKVKKSLHYTRFCVFCFFFVHALNCFDVEKAEYLYESLRSRRPHF